MIILNIVRANLAVVFLCHVSLHNVVFVLNFSVSELLFVISKLQLQ